LNLEFLGMLGVFGVLGVLGVFGGLGGSIIVFLFLSTSLRFNFGSCFSWRLGG